METIITVLMVFAVPVYLLVRCLVLMSIDIYKITKEEKHRREVKGRERWFNSSERPYNRTPLPIITIKTNLTIAGQTTSTRREAHQDTNWKGVCPDCGVGTVQDIRVGRDINDNIIKYCCRCNYIYNRTEVKPCSPQLTIRHIPNG